MSRTGEAQTRRPGRFLLQLRRSAAAQIVAVRRARAPLLTIIGPEATSRSSLASLSIEPCFPEHPAPRRRGPPQLVLVLLLMLLLVLLPGVGRPRRLSTWSPRSDPLDAVATEVERRAIAQIQQPTAGSTREEETQEEAAPCPPSPSSTPRCGRGRSVASSGGWPAMEERRRALFFFFENIRPKAYATCIHKSRKLVHAHIQVQTYAKDTDGATETTKQHEGPPRKEN